jgi:hypothetical protein
LRRSRDSDDTRAGRSAWPACPFSAFEPLRKTFDRALIAPVASQRHFRDDAGAERFLEFARGNFGAPRARIRHDPNSGEWDAEFGKVADKRPRRRGSEQIRFENDDVARRPRDERPDRGRERRRRVDDHELVMFAQLLRESIDGLRAQCERIVVAIGEFDGRDATVRND